MSKAGKRLTASLEEAVKIAKGEQPAARIHHQGHSYIPEAPVAEWREARRAFLALPAGKLDSRTSPEAKAALNRLAEAEDRLYNAT